MARRTVVKTPHDKEMEHGGNTAHSDRRDLVQTAANKAMLTQFKDLQIRSAEESINLCGGLALPSLALRYVLGQDAMPVGRIMAIGGAFGSCKTALAVEVARWFLCYGGLGWYLDAELRDSPDMRQAILRHDPAILPYMQYAKCTTQQMWQGAVSFALDSVVDMCPVRFDIPSIAIVDSVAAVKPAEDQIKFMKEQGGAGARGYASVALLNSAWLANVGPRVTAGPFCLLLIQHSTEKAVDGVPGATTLSHKGGGEIGYLKSVAFELSPIKKLKETNTQGGRVIRIKVSKNSLGLPDRYIDVPVRWWWDRDPVTGDQRQQYIWDWHHAALGTLFAFSKMNGRVTTWKAINEIVDLHEMSRGRVWSKALGIPKDNPVTLSEAGEILEYEKTELLPPLYDVLKIFRRPLLKPGECLKEMWNGKVPIQKIPAVVPYPKTSVVGGDDDE